MYLLLFILILVALIVVHEFGHFSVAKLFGIRVDEFGIGFPPRLWSVKWGETEYSINALFFGGFVRIFGENQNEAAHDPRSFAHKPRVVQAAVVCAGIVFNILFAWALLSTGYLIGVPTSVEHPGFGTVQSAQVLIEGVIPTSPADKAGLQASDAVESLQTATAILSPAPSASAVQQFIFAHQDESIIFTVDRGSVQKIFLAQPEAGLLGGRKVVGVELADVGVLKLPLPLALAQGAIAAEQMTVGTAQGLAGFFGSIFHGTADFNSVAGPIGIAGVGSKAVSEGFVAALLLAALISINLALINIIPIPGLDGGRLLIIIIEGIRRKPLPEKFSTILMLAGFGLLILLMLVVSYHDILRLMA
jgi:regulator of sigma E protease